MCPISATKGKCYNRLERKKAHTNHTKTLNVKILVFVQLLVGGVLQQKDCFAVLLLLIFQLYNKRFSEVKLQFPEIIVGSVLKYPTIYNCEGNFAQLFRELVEKFLTELMHRQNAVAERARGDFKTARMHSAPKRLSSAGANIFAEYKDEKWNASLRRPCSNPTQPVVFLICRTMSE